jgi:hypothetical protein
LRLGGLLGVVDQNLVRQAANLVLVAEKFQLDVVNGAEVDPDALVRVSSEACRILGMLRSKKFWTGRSLSFSLRLQSAASRLRRNSRTR